jgi:AAA family ATP:ADP antiporter
MPVRVLARVRAALNVQPGEGLAVALGAALFFCVLASYFVLKPVRDALAIDDDPRKIPWLFTGTFLTMLAVAPLWGWLVARWPRRRFVPIAYHAFAVQLAILFALVDGGVAPVFLSKVFFVWVSVFNLFVVSVFWSLAADAFTPEQARRLFPLVAVGGTAGALFGPFITSTFVHEIGVAGMLLIAGLFVELAVVVALLFDRASARARHGAEVKRDEPVGGGALDGLHHVAGSRYLSTISVYVLLLSLAATFLYLQQGEITKAVFATREARTAFFARLDLWTNLTVLAVQSLLTARLLGWLGVGVVLAALPLTQGSALFALALAPTTAVLAAVQVAGRTATHALARPGRELLFTAVPREDKYKAKNVIDTLIFRFGDMGSAWLYVGLVALGLGRVGLALFALPVVAAWLAIAFVLGRMHRRRAENR